MLTATVFAFLSGLTLCGLCGTLIEIASGRRLSLSEPFVSPDNISRSLVLVLLAGPFMAANEALAAVHERRIDRAVLAGVLCFCCIWLAAIGVFVLELVASARGP